FFKRRREECRGQVRAMVLHEMQPRIAEPHRLHLLRKACHGGAIPITMERMPESHRMTRNVCNLVGQIRVRIAPDGYVFDLARRDARQAGFARESRKTGPVLDPVQPLLFNREREFAIAPSRRRGIAMKCVEAEDVHFRSESSHSIASTRKRYQKPCRQWKTNPSLPSRNPRRRM